MSGFYFEASWLEIVNQKIHYASPCFKIVSHINLALFPQIAILRDPGTRDWRKKARENRDRREFTSSPGLVSAYLSTLAGPDFARGFFVLSPRTAHGSPKIANIPLLYMWRRGWSTSHSCREVKTNAWQPVWLRSILSLLSSACPHLTATDGT